MLIEQLPKTYFETPPDMDWVIAESQNLNGSNYMVKRKTFSQEGEEQPFYKFLLIFLSNLINNSGNYNTFVLAKA